MMFFFKQCEVCGPHECTIQRQGIFGMEDDCGLGALGRLGKGV